MAASFRAMATIATGGRSCCFNISQKACLILRLILFLKTAHPIFFVTTIPREKEGFETLFKMQKPRSVEEEYFDKVKILLDLIDIWLNRKFMSAFCSSARDYFSAGGCRHSDSESVRFMHTGITWLESYAHGNSVKYFLYF